MIPKKIHYCWFGGNPLSDEAKKCIESWRRFCPNYDIVEWNESNFNVLSNTYCREAYDAKKWAFVSDYARFWILYHHGGVYFDTDVELIKPLDEILDRGPFMGLENSYKKNNIFGDSFLMVAPGLGLAANPGLGLYKEILNIYEQKHYLDDNGKFNGKTVVMYVTELLKKKGLANKPGIQEVDGVFVYPSEYFCPKDYRTGIITITDKTISIHHYDGSWLTDDMKKESETYMYYYGILTGIPVRFIRSKVARCMTIYRMKGGTGIFEKIIKKITGRN